MTLRWKTYMYMFKINTSLYHVNCIYVCSKTFGG